MMTLIAVASVTVFGGVSAYWAYRVHGPHGAGVMLGAAMAYLCAVALASTW